MNQGKGLENNKVQTQAVVRAERGAPSLDVSPPQEERGWGLSTGAAYEHGHTLDNALASLFPTQPHKAGRMG